MPAGKWDSFDAPQSLPYSPSTLLDLRPGKQQQPQRLKRHKRSSSQRAEATMEYPLASPLPTKPPHPRDVGRKLLAARQDNAIPTCAYVNSDFSSSLTCAIDDYCIHNTYYNNIYCCNTLAYSFDNCGIGLTACVDSTNMADACTGDCLFNPAVARCTDGLDTLCIVTRFKFSTLSTYLTDFGCDSAASTIYAYDYYSSDGGFSYVYVPVSAYTVTVPASTTSSITGPLTPTTPVGSAPTTTTPINTPMASGLSAGAKAGISIGAVAAIGIIAGLLAFICFREQRRRHDRQQMIPQNLNQNPPAMIQQQEQPMASSPPSMNQQHMSMASMPSATSTTPLTQANIATMSQSSPSEVFPNESASQINGPAGTGSVLSGQGSPHTYHSGAGESGLGPLPEPHYPTGPSAFPHTQAGAPSTVMSTGSAWGSAPPVHAPSLSPR